LPSKLTKEEVGNLVGKLHQDANERKVKREKVKLKEVYADELTTESSKLVILEKFVNNFELVLLNLYNKKDSILITFDELVNLMFTLGFTRYDPKMEIPATEEKLTKKKEKEMKVLRDCWKVLGVNNKDISEEIERVDTNQLLVFCASVLGLYKGEKSAEDEKMEKME